jgi:hypothetical protein
MANAALQFDAASHTYTVGGRRLPSVTEVLSILDEFEGIPKRVLENARDRGARLHRAIDLFNRDDLDMDSLDDEIRPLVLAWAQFLKDTGAVVIASEQPVFHPQHRYAGTPDVVLAWKNGIAVPDIKATWAVPRSVGAQTAAYAEAIWASSGSRGRRPTRYCIHMKNGAYNLVPRDDPADWSLFLSALNIHRFKEAA